MGENRKGTICLLGAGASADASYPLASDLLEKFRNLLEQLDDGSAYVAPEPNSANRQFSQLDIFNRLWSDYEKSLDGTRAYLEDFFAFYDNRYNIGRVFAKEWGTQARHFESSLLRQLRSVALKVAYKELGAHQKTPTDYLRPLFALEGPEEYASAMATLNFDVTVEQQAHIASYNLYDGFREMRDLKPPVEWEGQTLHKLLKRWEHVSAIGHDFVGLMTCPPVATCY